MRGSIRFLTLIAVLLPFFAATASPLAAQEAAFPPPLTEQFSLDGADRLLTRSPDGTMAAALADDRQSLCTYAIPTGEEIACANLDEAEIDLRPEDVAWSPDSTTLAFGENALVTLRDGDLWLMEAATGELTNLTDDDYAGGLLFFDEDERPDGPIPVDIAPAWSPDGARIAFSRSVFPSGDDVEPTSALWIMELDSGEISQVAIVDDEEPGALYFTMAWSPDGATIYASVSDFSRDADGDGIWAFDVETGESAQILGPDPAFDNDAPALLSVSPAGDLMTVYYPAFLNSRLGAQSAFALFSIAEETATPIEPSTDLLGEEGGSIFGPTIAPDGETLLYYLTRFEEPFGILVARDLATGEDRVIATLPEEETPLLYDPGQPIMIGADGSVLIPTEFTTGYIARLPDDVLGSDTGSTAPPASTPAAEQGAVTYEPAADRLLAVSPDGSMVVGTPGMSPTMLCTYAVPSGEEIACADLENVSGHDDRIRLEMTDISWSPDSSTIAFAENPFTTFLDGDLWIMNAATGELTNVTDDGYEGELPVFGDVSELDAPVYADVIPRWSPDSSTLAFSRTVVTGPSEPTPSELWVLDVVSGESRRVARVAEEGMGILYGNLAWAPDGVTVYVSHYNYQNLIDRQNGIWAFNIESGAGEQIVGITERFDEAVPAVMAVSPRGDSLTIYYPRFISEFGLREGGYALFDLEAGEIVPLPVPQELESDTPVLTLSPGFSPDGASVIYGVRRFQTPASSLALIDLDSGDVEVVAEVADDSVPFALAIQDGIRINQDGVAFVQTSLNTGLLVPVPQVGLDAPPIAETPPIESEQATPEAAGADVQTGVATIGDEEAEIYAAPSFDGPVVLTLDAGAEVEIIGEPVTNDEGTWIPVRDPETRTIGYIPQDDLNE